MGNRLAKPPPLDRPIAPPRGGNNIGLQRPFPVLTPQSYIPGTGGGGLYPGFSPGGGAGNFPIMNQNSYMRPQGNLEPPIMNFSAGPSMLPPPMPYPNQGPMMAPQPRFYDPGSRRRSCRRPTRVCRRSRRSRHCRPVIRIIESSSCSSSYTSDSSCSPRRHRSHSHSRRCGSPPQQQQQQPIILLPIQCQQPQQQVQSIPVQNQIIQPQQQQQQPRQIVLPPIHIQQNGQYDQQPFTLPPMQIQQNGQYDQQNFTLPPMQYNSSNLFQNTSTSPVILSAGQSTIQPSMSLPQMTTLTQPQQIQRGPIQYVQAVPQSSSSSLQYISAEPRSTVAPQRVLVNSTNKKQSAPITPVTRSVARSISVRDVPQNDLKFGRRPFDWYSNDKKKDIINENVQVGQRRNIIVN